VLYFLSNPTQISVLFIIIYTSIMFLRNCINWERMSNFNTCIFYILTVVCGKRKSTKELRLIDEYGIEQTDYTVLAEFSSVVADTQQYIVPNVDEQGSIKQEPDEEDNVSNSLHLVLKM